MNVVVFGASGRTGLHLVRVALSRRHKVTAFVRDRSRLPMDYSRLRVVEGDVLDPAKVSEAVRGQDAVLCALGVPHRGPTTLLSEGIRRILAAMRRHGVRRLVCVTAAGVLGTDAWWTHRLFAVPILHRHAYADRRRQMLEIVDSALDWTLVRAPNLTDEPLKGRYEISLERPLHRSITRLDLAIFMVNQLRSREFIRKMPSVSN